MKKTFAALAVLLAVVSGIMFTGCDLFAELLDEYAVKDNTWCRHDIEYSVSDTSKVKLNCFLIYSENGYTNNKMQYSVKDPENAENVLKLSKLEPGLTIVIQPKASYSDANESSAVATLFKTSASEFTKVYALHTFGQDEDVGSNITISGNTWKAASAYLNYNGTLETCSMPAILDIDVADTYHNVEVDPENGFNWKNIAVMILLNQLTK